MHEEPSLREEDSLLGNGLQSRVSLLPMNYWKKAVRERVPASANALVSHSERESIFREKANGVNGGKCGRNEQANLFT